MEAYKVWATLSIKGDAHKKMEQFASLTKKASNELAKFQRLLKPIAGMFEKMAASLKILNPEFSKFSTTMVRLNVNTANSRDVLNSFNNTVNAAANRMASATSRANSFAASLNAVAVQSGLSSKAMGMMRGSSLKSGAMASGGSNKFLLGAASGLGLTNPLFMAGAGAAALGIHGFKQESEYQRSILQLRAQGFTGNQIAEANAIANQVRPGISQVDMIQAIVDAQMATRNFNQAKILAPILAQGKMSANVIYGGMTHKQQQDLIRVSELAGGSNTQNMANWLTVALQMMATSGGTIMPQEQRTFFRQAAGSMSRLSPLGYLAMEPMLQELGASRTGTALTTGILSLSNPQISHFARYKVDRLKALGLWDNKSNRVNASALDTLQTDPFLFLKNFWLPALARKGITSPGGIQTETMADLPRTFGQFMLLMFKNMEKIDRSRALAGHAMGGDELKRLSMTQGPEQQGFAVLRLSKAFDTLSDSIGKLSSPLVIKTLNAISQSFENLAKMITKLNSGDIKGGLKDMATNLVNITPVGYLGSKLMGGWGSNVAPPKPSAGNNQMSGHVYLDSRKVGSVFWSGAGSSIQSYVQHGTSGVNTLTAPVYPGVNHLGWQGQ